MKFTASIAATLLLITPAFAQTPSMDAALQALLASPKVVKTLDDIKADDARALEEQKRITEIPAPPFKEKVRGEYYLKRMQELGLKDAAMDSEGNVIALRKGTGGGRPKLVVSAHLDTVFPEDVDVTVKEKDGVINAPGIGDDSRGLAALLSLVKAMNENSIGTAAISSSSALSARKSLAICAASRRCSGITGISTASSPSMGWASAVSSTSPPAVIATR